MLHTMKVEFVSDLSNRHSVGKILFVGQYQESGIAEFIFPQHLLKFFGSAAVTSINTFSIVGVNYKDDGIGILVVVSPQRTDLVLTSDIPANKTPGYNGIQTIECKV